MTEHNKAADYITVKITGFQSRHYWYAKKVGEYIQVYPKLDSDGDWKTYHELPGEDQGHGYIDVNDCEIVSGKQEVEGESSDQMEFEKYPIIKQAMLEYAHFNYIKNWSGFLEELNKRLTPEPSDAIAFAQWIGEKRYVQGRKGEWFDNRLRLVASSTTSLYKLFKEEKK